MNRTLLSAAFLLLAGATSAAGQSPEAAPERSLVVVHPRAFAPALADYVAWRGAQLPVETAALEDVLEKERGVDAAEKLKRFLFTAWKDRKAAYVLLVGDADVLPVRYLVLDRVTPQAFDYAFYPSDLYYADLARADGTFEDWNGQREGFHSEYFGEVRGEKNKTDPINFDGIHYLPEIAVGRWPASNADEVRTIVAKTRAFEAAAGKGDAAVRRAAAFCVSGWIDARKDLDRALGKLPKGWESSRRYYADAGAGAPTPPPTEAEAVGLLNGGLGLLLHAGHGDDDRWVGCLSIASLAKIHNATAPPIMMSIGCSTARFATLPPYEAYLDITGIAHRGTNGGEVFTAPPPAPACFQAGRFNRTGLGEQFLRAGPDGAVAYIGCNTGGQPCAVTLLDAFAECLGRRAENPRLGDCWKNSVALYFERQKLAELRPNADWYPPSIFFQAMKYLFFGDPSLRLPDP